MCDIAHILIYVHLDMCNFFCYNISMSDYFKQRDEKNLAKIDEILLQLPDFVGQFIVGISSNTSALTRLNYATDIRIFFSYLTKYVFPGKNLIDISAGDIESLKPYDIERYINGLSSYIYDGKKLSCGERAKERKLASLRSLYKYLFKKEIISNNVALKVDMPKLHDKPIVRLETDEVDRLISTVSNGEMLSERERSYNSGTKERDMAIIYVFLGTGIRVSELVGLNRNDINFPDSSFVVTRKGGNKSILYMPADTLEMLKRYIAWLDDQIAENTEFASKIKDHDALFYSLQGSRIGVRTVEKLVKKYASSAAPLKKITPHKLRSTYATNLYNETEDIYVVADVLGHSDVNTTKKHYAQMSEEHKKRAAEATHIGKRDKN